MEHNHDGRQCAGQAVSRTHTFRREAELPAPPVRSVRSLDKCTCFAGRKRFLDLALSAEKPHLRIRPCVQSAAGCGVSPQL